MEKAISDLQGALSNAENSVTEVHSLITEVQSRLGNIYRQSSDRFNSLKSKVSKIGKTIKGYIDGPINEVQRLINQGNSAPNPVLAQDPTGSAGGVRNEVRQLREKNKTDELIIEGLQGLVADGKEQLDKPWKVIIVL